MTITTERVATVQVRTLYTSLGDYRRKAVRDSELAELLSAGWNLITTTATVSQYGPTADIHLVDTLVRHQEPEPRRPAALPRRAPRLRLPGSVDPQLLVEPVVEIRDVVESYRADGVLVHDWRATLTRSGSRLTELGLTELGAEVTELAEVGMADRPRLTWVVSTYIAELLEELPV